MEKFPKHNKNGLPLLDEDSYSTWKQRMTTYIQSTYYSLWTIIEHGHNVPQAVPTGADELKVYQQKIKAIGMLHVTFDEKVFDKVKDSKTTKEISDKLEQWYEGTSKSKELKLESLTEQLHQLKIRTYKDIRGYQDRVETLVSRIKGLGGVEVPDDWLTKRILRTITRKFESKVYVLEESKEKLTSEYVFKTLYHHESRINQEDEPSAKEASFKTISKHEEGSPSKQKGKTHSYSDSDDEEIANFIRRLPRGLGKYKGKLPLKCSLVER